MRTRSLLEWMDRGFHTDDELVGMVCDRGPYAYLDLAQQHG